MVVSEAYEQQRQSEPVTIRQNVSCSKPAACAQDQPRLLFQTASPVVQFGEYKFTAELIASELAADRQAAPS